jgi:hypothetical protein
MENEAERLNIDHNCSGLEKNLKEKGGKMRKGEKINLLRSLFSPSSLFLPFSSIDLGFDLRSYK